MGYECPVCEVPQSDSGHLANHIAFTALIHGADHEEWLDENVPDWSDLGEDELADAVVAHTEETEFPQMFEDTTGMHRHDHDERSGQLFDEEIGTKGGRQQQLGNQPAALDTEAQSILREARRMTDERLDEE